MVKRKDPFNSVVMPNLRKVRLFSDKDSTSAPSGLYEGLEVES